VAAKGYPKRYAKAIFEIALDQKTIEKWQADLSQMASLTDDNVLLTLLESPRLTFEDKKRLVDERLTSVSPMAHNTVYLLIERNRMGLLKHILEEYHRLIDVHTGTLHAKVTTAVALEQAEREKISQTLENIIGKRIVMETEVDPGIIGGFIARINGTLLDGSVRGKLLTLKKELGTSRS
jgi:F-type H+-transporting ATPase subunit delta